MAHKTSPLNKGYAPFLIPGIVAFLAIVIIPFLVNIGISFTRWGGVKPPVWIGLENYQNLFQDNTFWTSFTNNMILIIAMVIIPTAIGLLLATFLFDYITTKFGSGVSSFFRAGFYLPQILPAVVAAVVWRWILQPDWGTVNYILTSVGLSTLAHNWLGEPATALPAVMVVIIWVQIGYPVVIFMAALQRLDPEYLEAATIDGASWLQRFFYITVPLIRPETFVVVLTTTIYTLKVFGQIYVLTKGGPGNATNVPEYFAYRNFFEIGKVGYGASIATVMTMIIIALTILFINLQMRQEREERQWDA